MYDSNVMSDSITNGVQVFFCFIFKISAWDSMGSMIFVWRVPLQRAPPLARCQFQPLKPKDLLQDLPSSKTIQRYIFPSTRLAIFGHALHASCHHLFFCWTTDQPPQKSRTCAAATIFLELESQKVSMQALATSDCVKRESCWRDSSFGSQCRIRCFKHQSLTYIIYVCIYKYITYYKKETAIPSKGLRNTRKWLDNNPLIHHSINPEKL